MRRVIGETLSSRFFYVPTETVSAAAYGVYWRLRAVEHTKVFSVTLLSSRPVWDERPCYVKVSDDPSTAGSAYGKTVGLGFCGAYRDYVVRFSPPLLLQPNEILILVIHAEPADEVDAYYEASVGLEILGAYDAGYTAQYWDLIGGATSANAYADSAIMEDLAYDEVILGLKCATQNVKMKILASLDGSNYDIELQAETTYTAGADPIIYRITEQYPCIKVQYKSAAAGVHGAAYAMVSIKKQGGWK